ncbi:MAG TPA: 4-hydroxythreonine-4-phosphate dehydrogenase PdxA [Thermoanaerobaculia bacterium]|nr:4-hydroxythreonine-4-phosphate dehydrogenase PdxA [Thermoanaerobaculia bacterium]
MKPLAITLGDPAGIGAEVVRKALETLDVPHRLFGEVQGPVRYGEISAEYGRIALDAIAAAVDAVERGECSALVTAPIHKQSIALAGSPFPGHTELLAARAGLREYGRDYAMYFDSPALRTVLLSVHEPLRDAIAAVDAERIAALASLMAREYARLYGTEPRIAVAGVNPHAGEGGRFGDEELIVAKGVELARAAGLQVSGPHPPDTVFLAAANGKYDVVMAMYHDQGLIPVKTLAFEKSVNVTIGLPWLRVSVDHGTAFDIAGKGIADAAPMRYAIEWAARHAGRYAR